MNILSSHTPSIRTLSLSLMALILTLATPPAEAQTVGEIHIGGKVYGGGKNGAIGISNTEEACLTEEDSTKVTVTDNTLVVSDVQIHSGNIKTVFGGGEQGRSYGKTTVSVSGGTIGIDGDADLANGNVFGAGDGWKAHVYGGSSLLVTGGTIKQSVYGGGNEADLMGSTLLTLRGGTYVGAVYGGAKLANIYGRTLVNVDGVNATNDLHIIDVYGGNDIAGEIQPSEHWNWTKKATVEASLPTLYDGTTFTLADTEHLTKKPASVVNGSWNAFVLATKGMTYKTLIDNVYGGGNGDYDYASDKLDDGVTDNPYKDREKPVIGKTYMQLEGGMYGSVYGGGNAATVSESTDICLVNTTNVSDYLGNLATLGSLGNLGGLTNKDGYSAALDNKELLKLLGESASCYSADYQFNRVFGGNNKEPMAIRPNWYLEDATVNNLYSGGNAGPMTYFKQTSTGAASLAGDGGIILHVESADMTINNVYGGCRMADVIPNNQKVTKGVTLNPETFGTVTFGTVTFQPNYAARVLITGGNINNVYGGNDVSGNVYFGSQVEILSSINGDVYGAGNGSYAYTDKASWVTAHPEDADYYYDPSTAASSVEALNNWRPNAEKTWVHVAGKDVGTPTVIGGSLYCGGNSATLRTNGGSLADAKAHLQIGSDVICNQVFQGSNGVNMISQAMLQKYADNDFSTLDLTNASTFDKYMEGVEVAIQPEVAFDTDYADHSARFGSLYCGGNVGSMSADGLFTINFLNSLLIYDKLVAGSNSANVKKTQYNAFHLGGLIGAPDATSGNKVQLNISGLKLEPHVLNGSVTTGFNLNQWHYADPDATKKMLAGANIYGGCYDSGYINGGVAINITENAISDMVAGSGVQYETIQNDVLASTLSVYGGGYGPETEIWGKTTINITGNGQIMKAYGGGEMGVVGKLDRYQEGDVIPAGKQVGDYKTAIVQEWYSETANQDLHGYVTPVTEYKSRDHSVAQFVTKYNATVNLNANLLANDNLNVAKLYGGGFQGTVSGNTIVNLNRGRVYDAFGGASNADILGHTEMYVGKASAPTVTHNVYGANDFGGLIVGRGIFYVDNNKDGDHEDTMEKILSQTYVEYNSGSIAGDLFGGPCGDYEYSDTKYNGVIEYYTLAEYQALPGKSGVTQTEFDKLHASLKQKPGFCRPQLLENLLSDPMLIPDPEGIREHVGYAANSFVNVVSQSTLAADHIGGSIFGAGQGTEGRIKSADERGSYVRLMSATKTQRTTAGVLAARVYGAGFCSNTNRSLVDAYTGYYDKIFGGAHGITYEDVLHLINEDGFYETNYMGYRAAVRLHDMANNQMDIYGGGANAGAEETGVVLNGGQARNVYGGSYAQGITYAASVEIPAESTSKVNAIFGGAEGGSDEFPCDVYNTFVTWKSPNARVQDAIYGGNNAYRMTRNAYISVYAPVRNFDDQLTNVFGGGYGPETVTLYTSVGLQDGAQVANVYGGGNNGQVLDTPSFRYYLDDGKIACADGVIKPEADGLKTYPTELLGRDIYGYQKYLNDSEVIGFHNWIVQHCWDGTTKDGRQQPLGSYTANAHGHAHPVYFLSTQMDNMKNTNVYINKGALVAENAYGGGYGEDALVSGETMVHLWGGTVEGDVYGGGYGGPVAEYPHLIFPAGGQHELTMSSTHVDLQGGIARNVYGGGLNGDVTGSTDVVLGTKDQHENDFYGTVISGVNDNRIIYGDPIVERSLYGGGQNGAVYGTAYLTLNQGHVGYKYVAPDADAYAAASDSEKAAMNAAAYVENLDLNDPGDNFLDQNGNVFGAGYGEEATVDVTYVNIYGGTIRNSLYGGGEIAAVGQVQRADNKPVFVNGKPNITTAGRTHVYMYKGLVQGDVFGGGRGYSFDLTGNEVIGKKFYTDGYVFGTTDVEIRGGIVGTEKTVADGHGNVFGGGNIGYCYTDAVKDGEKGKSNGNGGTYTGRYYTNAWKCNDSHCGYIDYCHDVPTVCGKCGKSTSATDSFFKTSFTKVLANGTAAGTANEYILSEDCRVVVSPWAQVIAEGGITITGNGAVQPDGSVLSDSTFVKGSYVPTAYLDLLKDKNTDANSADPQWPKLSLDGVTVRNAVFAGGNISSGSDKVYANAYTVFGNATASVNDVFFRDLITLGTEHTGGLYGDGNLTFVDGYRELNVTNFGTDYYGQQDHITIDQYNAMNDRERAYFELEYQPKASIGAHQYTYYVCNVPGTYGGTNYERGDHITVAEYNALPEDKKNTTNWTYVDKTYAADVRIKEGEWDKMTADEQAKWDIFGFCSIYAGRLLNTIQRADFCGVFGSRLVLQGAQDRVPEVVDYTQYTINRVGELSLNKKEYEGADKATAGIAPHGNYFGMYNIVNYLGAITSDVRFDDVRTTDNEDASYSAAVTVNGQEKAYGTATYYDWKVAHQGDRKRNNGTCHNTVALAAGVYLELVNEPATTMSPEDRLDPNLKDWGYITGIVQLDLINVMPGLGGGYVYAKNEHGTRSGSTGAHENLSIYNASAVNNSLYEYSSTDELIETSGNFIHNVKQIVDDCFPRGGDLSQPAHYWYIRGEFYVYDQYISAFTGSSTAYQENINLPLTITAGANGRLDIIDIKQNYYAYWKDEAMTQAIGANDAIVVNNITYGLNDIITWWDYMQLNDQQKKHFVKDTYVAQKDYCTSATSFDGDGNPTGIVEKGRVILPTEYESIKSQAVYDPEDIRTVEKTPGVYEKEMNQIFMSDVFHVSNAVSHDNGYVLAVKLDNPGDWDSWYSPQSGAKKINQADYDKPETVKTNYLMGPTYYTETPGVYGQHQHVLDEIVTQAAKTAYDLIPEKYITDIETAGKNQATVSAAYVAVTAAEYDYNDGTKTIHKNLQAGVGISAEEYATLDSENKAKFAPAYTCLSTFEEDASNAEYIYFGTLIPATKYQELRTQVQEAYETEHPGASPTEVTKYVDQVMSNHFDKAYIVTKAGYYGGQEFKKGQNYRALDTWATLSAADRENFQFRYDALDALLFSNTSVNQGYYPATSTTPETGYYPGTGEESVTPGDNNIKYYDGPYWNGAGTDASPLHQVYGAKLPIDYTAKYNGTESDSYLTPGKTYTREEYENLPNERRHYSAFNVDEKDKVNGNFPTYYIVKESFISGGTNYAAGKTISEDTYNSFDATRQAKIQTFTPTTAGTYYICRESYTIGEKGEGQSVRDIRPSGQTYTTGQVPSGVIINSANYTNLVNKQLKGFTIIGNSPIETSTFYVNRESDIYDLSKDRVVTVIYQYKYEESDESGNNVEEITERHVINIHITFKSGVPTIGKLQDPSIVLPGQTVGLKSPGVTPGAYEILGAGWELFTNPEDAEKHTNGKTYINNATPMYWYQDGYYVAYYAKTYLGKTYSNSVPFKVANYHDMAEVMADNENYMFIDHPNVKRNSKIYIHDNVVENLTVNHDDAVDAHGNDIADVVRTESEIDMLYSLFQNSLETSLKRTYVPVQDQEEDASHKPLYWQVDSETGKPTTTKTTAKTDYPVYLYYKVDASGNKTNETTTDITAYPVTHQEAQDVPVLNDHVRNLANLDFFLSDNVSTAKEATDNGDGTTSRWKPIGWIDNDPEVHSCFMGTLHGMGYTISGLDKSLFENLCGYVYNLGVTGSFTKSGVADNVSTGTVPDTDPEVKVHGHVNSSWIYTSADPNMVGKGSSDGVHMDQTFLPVVGEANNLSLGVAGVHTLNCYYPEECGYYVDAHYGPNTTANSATLREFNNGEVAYNLNGFYLNKRYSDNALSAEEIAAITGHTSPTTGDAAIYKYWKQTSDGTLETTPTTGYYKNGGSMHAYGSENLGYVERLFADGDFVYKYGTIPLQTNERYSTSDSRYLPVWPDDYYFFGQQLTYGYDEIQRPYQPLPSHVRKTISKDGSGKDSRLVTTEQNNVIYRLPAYFRSAEKKWAHFNPYAVFADHMEEGYTLGSTEADKVLDGKKIHPGLTAIDFTGHNDFTIWTKDHKFYGAINTDPKLVYSNGARNIPDLVAGKSTENLNFSPLNDGAYFGPITDYTTVMRFETHDITQNLLTYAPTTTYSPGTAHTLQVLQDYYNEPEYATYYDKVKSGYRTVAALDESRISSIHGHLVQKENSADLDRHYYYAASDHFLVDKQDFNAPFEYEFNPPKGVSDYNYRMWYQRTPDNYADQNKGWEGVSLPFGAELVSTQDKGEITHFYKNRLGTGYEGFYDSGHEYWLREFTGIAKSSDTNPSANPDVTTALMNYPTGELNADTKTVDNTFLWDYYYNADGKDLNGDDYRHEYDNGHAGDEQDLTRYYYGAQRQFEEYPLSQAGKPYIVGFPGSRYYEFDLSGTFVPEHSGTITPVQLDPQTISFVSDTGITIRVSDEETADVWNNYDKDAAALTQYGGFAFAPNYLNVTAPISSENNNYYVMNSEGSAFEKTETEEKPVAAFRPFFSTAGVSELADHRLKAPQTRSIVFGMGENTSFEPDEETLKSTLTDGLHVSVKKHKIIVESGMNHDVNVRIVSAAGVTISTFDICPGERVETAIDNAGVYIVNTKKVLVK